MNDLLPCPFCGAEATYRPGHYVIVVAHDRLDCECLIGDDVTFACTPEQWNRRAAPPAIKASETEWGVAILKERVNLYKRIRELEAAPPAPSDALRDALEEAASSLEALSRANTKAQPLLDTMQNIRGYANSRAIVARAALTPGETAAQTGYGTQDGTPGTSTTPAISNASGETERGRRYRCQGCGRKITEDEEMSGSSHWVGALTESGWCGPVVEEGEAKG